MTPTALTEPPVESMRASRLWLILAGLMLGMLTAVMLVSLALMLTGAIVGVFSGGPPLRRALRQLAIGIGAAACTYLLGLLFGAMLG